MESKIKWQTGKPKEKGIYFVTYKFSYYPTERPLEKAYSTSIGTSYWEDFWHQYDDDMTDCKVTAWCKLSDVEPYKEETMKNKLEQITLDIPNGYEFFGIDDDNKIVLTKKQSQYPKTYEECCDILEYPYNIVGGYKAELLSSFQNLLICRDVYWKIAGAQMGLGEPWKPDWLNTEQDKFVLYTHDNVICLRCFVLGHNVLAFPTAEMRDAFLENFKDLIEDCKELL